MTRGGGAEGGLPDGAERHDRVCTAIGVPHLQETHPLDLTVNLCLGPGGVIGVGDF